jgi:hypothetical protein
LLLGALKTKNPQSRLCLVMAGDETRLRINCMVASKMQQTRPVDGTIDTTLRCHGFVVQFHRSGFLGGLAELSVLWEAFVSMEDFLRETFRPSEQYRKKIALPINRSHTSHSTIAGIRFRLQSRATTEQPCRRGEPKNMSTTEVLAS